VTTFDWVAVGVVSFFALWGAIAGFSRQVGQYVAFVGAWAGCGLVGHQVGPRFAPQLGVRPAIAVVLCTVMAFAVLFLVIRFVVSGLLRRFLAGQEGGISAGDRLLGLVLGGVRAGLLVYLLLCAMALVESQVTVGGSKMVVGPKNSPLFAWAKAHNVLERQLFGDVGALAAFTAAAKEAQGSGSLATLAKDPRVQRLLTNKEAMEAAKKGDTKAFLAQEGVLELLTDSRVMKQLGTLTHELRTAP
jgi:uncharacterized membrane protein required for colicin V production